MVPLRPTPHAPIPKWRARAPRRVASTLELVPPTPRPPPPCRRQRSLPFRRSRVSASKRLRTMRPRVCRAITPPTHRHRPRLEPRTGPKGWISPLPRRNLGRRRVSKPPRRSIFLPPCPGREAPHRLCRTTTAAVRRITRSSRRSRPGLHHPSRLTERRVMAQLSGPLARLRRPIVAPCPPWRSASRQGRADPWPGQTR